MCGKRLKAALPVLVTSLEGHGHLTLDTEVRRKLLAISPATIDRILQPVRVGAGRKRRRPKKPNVVQRQVPVRTHRDADQLEPGHFEVDFVVHSGGVTMGSCTHTFTLTDVCSGWTECFALLARQQMLVVEALELIRPQLPFPMLGLDSDNDGAFLNETLFDYLKEHGLEQTRSRPYRSNDQAWVEQKNGSVVRHFAGYGRLEGLAATAALSELYRHVRLYVNYFQPSFKLRSKKRDGAKVKKFYWPPATPCDRLLDDPRVHPQVKGRLLAERELLDPVELLYKIREAQAVLADLPNPQPGKKLDEFLKLLPDLWREGEPSPTRKRSASPTRTWRTREDPFEAVWSEVLSWLEVQPELAARTILERLQLEYPDAYPEAQLRTLQRRVKSWRHAKARELIAVSDAVTGLAQESHLGESDALQARH